jgi:DNA polymerase I-like protein with 3'-5' exonuclease and polymerase domains
VEVACDLETKGLNPYASGTWIITCQFSAVPGKSDVLYFEYGEKPVQPLPWKGEEEWSYWEALWVQLDWIFRSEKVSIRGANFKFDSTWLNLHWEIKVMNFKFDTMLVGSLLNENRSNSLKLHAKIYTNMGGYEDGMDKYDFGALEKVPRDELLLYAGGDTDVTLQVSRVMKEEILRDKALSNFYVKLLHPAAQVFEVLERTGVLVDRVYYGKLQQELEIEIARIQGDMLACLPNKLRIKYRDDIVEAMGSGKSPFKPKILQEFLFTSAGLNLKPKLFTEKTKVPSTAMEHLMMFGDDPVAANFIGLFKELGSATKTLSTFVVGFLKHLRPDGRFHASYMLHRGDYGSDDSGTTTGRTSAKDPAIQTLPKHSKWAKKLRKAYIAPPGHVILNVDFSQGELRICAVLANEPTMIKAYQAGVDLHAMTAAQLSGYEYNEFMALPEDVRDELRFGGKAGNFGLIYGMQHKGFREYAYTTYGVSMTDEEAYIKREKFFELYSRLLAWHETYKQYAHQYQMVRSPLGRIRHLPLIASKDNDMVSQAERQAINSPVQSCLSDMMQLAMVIIHRTYGDKVKMFMMTHDSLSVYVKEDEAEVWAKRLKEMMENLPLARDFGWNSPLTFYADAEIGPNLAEMKKLKNL